MLKTRSRRGRNEHTSVKTKKTESNTHSGPRMFQENFPPKPSHYGVREKLIQGCILRMSPAASLLHSHLVDLSFQAFLVSPRSSWLNSCCSFQHSWVSPLYPKRCFPFLVGTEFRKRCCGALHRVSALRKSDRPVSSTKHLALPFLLQLEYPHPHVPCEPICNITARRP